MAKRAYIETIGEWQMTEIKRSSALAIIQNAPAAFRKNGVIYVLDRAGYPSIKLTTTTD